MTKYNNFLSSFAFKLDYSPYGNQFVSGSHDGCIKLWDGVSNKCTATFSNAHDGEEVCSVKFSRNGKVGCQIEMEKID